VIEAHRIDGRCQSLTVTQSVIPSTIGLPVRSCGAGSVTVARARSTNHQLYIIIEHDNLRVGLVLFLLTSTNWRRALCYGTRCFWVLDAGRSKDDERWQIQADR
jgi:hypothetical protein